MNCSKTKRRENRRTGMFLAALGGLNILFQALKTVENLVTLLKH